MKTNEMANELLRLAIKDYKTWSEEIKSDFGIDRDMRISYLWRASFRLFDDLERETRQQIVDIVNHQRITDKLEA